MPNTHPRTYQASSGEHKFSDALARLNGDPEYSKKIGIAIRPLARALSMSGPDDDMALTVIRDTIECFGNDPELAVQYLLSMLDQSLTRLVQHR